MEVWWKKKKRTHSFFRAFMFHSCKYPSENPTASWLVLEMYCRAVAPTPLGPFSWRQRCLPCLVLTSLSLGISPGDLVTTCRSGKRDGLDRDREQVCTHSLLYSRGTCIGTVSGLCHTHVPAWLDSVWLEVAAQCGRDLHVHFNRATCLMVCF